MFATRDTETLNAESQPLQQSLPYPNFKGIIRDLLLVDVGILVGHSPVGASSRRDGHDG